MLSNMSKSSKVETLGASAVSPAEELCGRVETLTCRIGLAPIRPRCTRLSQAPRPMAEITRHSSAMASTAQKEKPDWKVANNPTSDESRRDEISVCPCPDAYEMHR